MSTTVAEAPAAPDPGGRLSPSTPFILRPVATTLLMCALFLAGAVAFFQLPVSALPEVDYPTIQVITFYPGASPAVVAATVTAPLERQFGQVAGLSQMTSSSSGGLSVIVMTFQLSLNIDVAEQEVQAAINAAQSYLPANLPTPPLYSKSNPADAPVLTLALTSNEVPLSRVEDLADTRLSPKISQIYGVGLVTISGGQKPAVRIQANPTALASYGIGMEDLRASLVGNSLSTAKGSFDGPARSYTINANDQLQTSDSYSSVVVAYRNGAPVLLDQVARVVDGVENTKLAAWQNLTPAVLVNIQRQPGANTIQVVDRIRALLPQLVGTLPRAVHVAVVTDRTTSIRSSVRDVEFELLLAIMLVVAVIFLFLRSLAATLIPSIAVPLSLIGTFGVMYLLGYSINNLAMMALTIATGFVVDDAIVMIENITRYIEAKVPPLQAALQGAQQIGFTILSLTVSLVAVLIPLLFMGDIAGRLFRQFAVTLATTIIISAFVSLTLTPMMCARLLHPHAAGQQSRFYMASERVFDSILNFYARTLKWVLGHERLALAVATATVALTALMYMTIPKGFFPTQDTGILQGISQAAGSRSFDWMKSRQLELVRALLSDPAVDSVSSFIGADGINTTLNSGRFQINLKPLGERGISATELIHRLNQRVREVPGIRLYMRPVQDLTVDDRVSRTAYQYTLEDPDGELLQTVAADLVKRLEQLPQLSGVTTDQQPGGIATVLNIDRATAARFGITPQAIDDTLYDAYGQRQINTIFTQVNQYHVILETDPRFQLDPRDLGDLYIPSALGTAATTVPMNTGGSSAGAGAGAAGVSGNALLTPSAGGVAAPVASTSAVSSNTSTVLLTTPGVLNLATTSALSSAVNTSRSTTVLTAPTVTLPLVPAASTGGVPAAAAGTLSGAGAAGGAGGLAGGASAAGAAAAGAGGGGGGGGAASASTVATSNPVPFSAFTHAHTQDEPLVITRQGQFPAITLSFNLGHGYSLGQAISAINRVIKDRGLPASVIAGYQGTAAAFEGSQANEGLLVLAAVVTVYIVLGVLYESFIHPITILSTLPSAALGALLALRLFGLDLDIVAIIGIILLIGIVQKNGIMMVDFALEAERREGKSAPEAIYQAAQLRFRPILMTTLAALLSGVPLAFGTGIGSELRRPLGVAMVGGLLVSQILTLYTTPVIYIFFDRLGARLAGRRASGAATA